MGIIARGAEAILYKDEAGDLLKERVKKTYRIAEIDDMLRKRRTKNEASLIRKARSAGVCVPQVIEEEKFVLKLEYIDGKKVKDIFDKKNCKEISEKIGMSVALLHNFDIIHGDLTTSNMIIKNKVKNDAKQNDARSASNNFTSFDLYFIDFGLGFISKRPEDKATDLYLLHEALESTHFDIMKNAWKIILKAYIENYGEAKNVINTLKKIEMRRRYTKKE
jgi:Kae1-associated kinase Bud32